jgi:hypothetical protein
MVASRFPAMLADNNAAVGIINLGDQVNRQIRNIDLVQLNNWVRLVRMQEWRPRENWHRFIDAMDMVNDFFLMTLPDHVDLGGAQEVYTIADLEGYARNIPRGASLRRHIVAMNSPSWGPVFDAFRQYPQPHEDAG